MMLVLGTRVGSGGGRTIQREANHVFVCAPERAGRMNRGVAYCVAVRYGRRVVDAWHHAVLRAVVGIFGSAAAAVPALIRAILRAGARGFVAGAIPIRAGRRLEAEVDRHAFEGCSRQVYEVEPREECHGRVFHEVNVEGAASVGRRGEPECTEVVVFALIVNQRVDRVQQGATPSPVLVIG